MTIPGVAGLGIIAGVFDAALPHQGGDERPGLRPSCIVWHEPEHLATMEGPIRRSGGQITDRFQPLSANVSPTILARILTGGVKVDAVEDVAGDTVADVPEPLDRGATKYRHPVLAVVDVRNRLKFA